jgi:hypothetical protein
MSFVEKGLLFSLDLVHQYYRNCRQRIKRVMAVVNEP